MSATSSAPPDRALAALDGVRRDVDEVLRAFLDDRRAELAALDRSAAEPVDEIRRLLDAGGKRLRPALCVWAYRAAGGRDTVTVLRAAAALELLHTFAVIHDDVMDGSSARRGAEATHVRFADPDRPRRGISVAILVGDLAAVLAERLLRSCGATPDRLATVLTRFDRMRLEMAAGQYLDVAGSASPADRLAALKTGSYTAEGPVLIGTALAQAPASVERPLAIFARHVGEAFQLRDDILDGDAGPREQGHVDDLVGRALAALEGAPLEPRAAAALRALAELVRDRDG
jgi:geranylgeranyl diphosphate synthase type I